MTRNTTPKGIVLKKHPNKPLVNKVHEKPIKIFNKIWPLIILANNRIAKLNIFEMYEMYSNIIKAGIIATGIPSGKNNSKYFSLWCNTLIIFVPIKKLNEKYKVTIKWLVTVILYGIKPNKLEMKIKQKVKKNNVIGEYFFNIKDSLNKVKINSKKNWAL